ncbi:MAG: lysophospholipase [Ruminococcus sp.]|nr:lysophospholipase [Ruminococcus sp.]
MKKSVRKFTASLMGILITASGIMTNSVHAEVISNPVISTDCPAYSQTGMTSYANDEHYFSFWSSSGADYLAYDLSEVPENQRKKVIAVWYNATGAFDYTVGNGGSNGVPYDYTIEVNSAVGGTYPEDNWEVIETVTGNTLHSRQHVIDMDGYNWIRLNITGNDGKSGGNTSINFDIHNVSDGVSDSWIFYGDSITACGMMNCYGTGFAEFVHQIDDRYFPVQENGGIGGITSTHGAENIDRWLEAFQGKYVSVAYGTNDAWGNPSNTEKYYENTSYMVEKIIESGKIPVVPKIPYATESAVGDNVPAYNAMIEKIYEKYPEVVKGPDFEKLFRENPELLSADGVHPNDDGYATMRKLWAETMYETVYSSDSNIKSVNGDVNSDGKFDIADLVMLQKWLLGSGNLTDWHAGDLDKNNIIDVFDLCMMRKLIINS